MSRIEIYMLIDRKNELVNIDFIFNESNTILKWKIKKNVEIVAFERHCPLFFCLSKLNSDMTMPQYAQRIRNDRNKFTHISHMEKCFS